MKMNVQVVMESEEGLTLVEDAASVTRDALSAENLGLRLTDTKTLLHRLQERLVNQQIDEYLHEQRGCPHGGRPRLLKGHHTLVICTTFGIMPTTGT